MIKGERRQREGVSQLGKAYRGECEIESPIPLFYLENSLVRLLLRNLYFLRVYPKISIFLGEVVLHITLR